MDTRKRFLRRQWFGAGRALVAGCALLLLQGASPAAAPNVLAAGKGRSVFVLPIHGPIDKSLLFVFRRAFRQERETRPAAIIVDLNTPGGALRETEEILQWLRSVKIPTYAFVNPHALSAGAIISLGTDAIYMAPGSRIGSAMPVMLNPFGGGIQQIPEAINEKILSDTRALVRGLAEENGYDKELAMAMVDRSVEFKIGKRVICKSGELLNLTAREAAEIIPPRTKPLLAAGIVKDIPELLDKVGLRGASIVQFTEMPADRLARFITMFGPIIFALGALGIYLEFKTPGFGLPGIFGVVCLIIYFFGHYVAGLAGLEAITLVMIGFILLGIEVFAIPGFGIPGLIGLACIVAGFFWGLIPHLPSLPLLPGLDEPLWKKDVQTALWKTLATLFCGGFGVYILARVLPKTSAYGSLVLQMVLDRDKGYVASGGDQPVGAAELVGRRGVALTPLHPAGKAKFGTRRLDVVSSGDLVPKGARVRILRVEGSRVVVEAVPPARENGKTGAHSVSA